MNNIRISVFPKEQGVIFYKKFQLILKALHECGKFQLILKPLHECGMYDIYEQRKCFTGMKKNAKFDILILRLAEALYSTVSYNKNMSFWPACLDRCGKIKKFWCETLSVLSKPVRTNSYG